MHTSYVLVVDDDPNVRSLIEDVLTMFGYQVRIARSGQEALSAVAREAPSAMILDLMMPGMTGFSVLANLRRMSGGRHIPVIVLSALIDQVSGIDRLPGVVGVMCKGQWSMEAFRKLMERTGVAAQPAA